MSRTIQFIDTVVKNLKPSKKREIYWCDGCPGFGLRITPTGTKTFVFKYMNGRQSRWLTLGKYPRTPIRDARAEYHNHYAQVSEYGKDPVHDIKTKKERDLPLEYLIDQYVEIGKLKGKKFITEEERYLRNEVLPIIGNKAINKITANDIDTIQKNIILRSSKNDNASRNGRVAAKHAVACTRRVLNLAIKRGVIDHNPAYDIDLLGQTGKRDRILSFKEIWLVWHGLNDDIAPPVTTNGIRFMLATMQRGIEVRNMRYDALKLDEAIWQMEMSDTKNKQMHRVPLNQIALDLINHVKPFTQSSAFVFGATRAKSPPVEPNTKLHPSTTSAYSQAMRRCRKALDIENICPHDLRRTGATWITAVGLPKLYARLMLNHSDGDRDVTGEVYVQYGYDFEKRRAVDVWEFVLTNIINCRTLEDIPTLDQMREAVRKSGLL